MAASSSDSTDGKLAEAKRISEEMKAELLAKKQAQADSNLLEASRSLPADPKCKIQTRRTLRGHMSKIYALNWCQDSNHLVSAAQDGKLIVWHAHSTNKVAAIGLRSWWVMTCAYSPSGALIASGGLDNCCSVFNLRNLDPQGNPNMELNQHSGFLSCVRFESDTSIITGSGDHTCMKWDVNTSTVTTTFTGHTADVICLALSPEKNTFISGSCDHRAKLWDIRTGKHVMTFRGHEADINSCAFFPSGTAFATGSDDASVYLWDIRSGQQIQQYKDESSQSGITSVDFSVSGKYLFGGYDKCEVRTWDTLKREVVSSLSSHQNRVSCLGVPANGECFATGSWDAYLKIHA